MALLTNFLKFLFLILSIHLNCSDFCYLFKTANFITLNSDHYYFKKSLINNFKLYFNQDKVHWYFNNQAFFGLTSKLEGFKIDQKEYSITFPKEVKNVLDLETYLNNKLSNDFKIELISENEINDIDWLNFIKDKKIPISSKDYFTHDLMVHFEGFRQLSKKKKSEMDQFLSLLEKMTKLNEFIEKEVKFESLKETFKYYAHIQVNFIDFTTANQKINQFNSIEFTFPKNPEEISKINDEELFIRYFPYFFNYKKDELLRIRMLCEECSDQEFIFILSFIKINYKISSSMDFNLLIKETYEFLNKKQVLAFLK